MAVEKWKTMDGASWWVLNCGKCGNPLENGIRPDAIVYCPECGITNTCPQSTGPTTTPMND